TAATKPPEIVEARMDADRHAILLGFSDDPAHDQRVAGMKTAGDIGRADDFQDPRIVADVIGAEPLSHVCIQIHLDGYCSPLVLRRWVKGLGYRAISSLKYYC